MWKYENFSAIQILCVNKFAKFLDFSNSETGKLAIVMLLVATTNFTWNLSCRKILKFSHCVKATFYLGNVLPLYSNLHILLPLDNLSTNSVTFFTWNWKESQWHQSSTLQLICQKCSPKKCVFGERSISCVFIRRKEWETPDIW